MTIKYSKEYMIFVKKITDKYISILTQEPPMEWDGICFGSYRQPTDEEVSKFYKDLNELALKWLKDNMINYSDWLLTQKKNK